MVWARALQQLRLEGVGDGRFSGARQAGEPENARFLMLEDGALGLVERERLEMYVAGAPQGECDDAGRRDAVGGAVDQDEGAGGAVVGIGVEGDRF